MGDVNFSFFSLSPSLPPTENPKGYQATKSNRAGKKTKNKNKNPALIEHTQGNRKSPESRTKGHNPVDMSAAVHDNVVLLYTCQGTRLHSAPIHPHCSLVLAQTQYNVNTEICHKTLACFQNISSPFSLALDVQWQ